MRIAEKVDGDRHDQDEHEGHHVLPERARISEGQLCLALRARDPKGQEALEDGPERGNHGFADRAPKRWPGFDNL